MVESPGTRVIKTVVVCSARQAHWDSDQRPKCVDRSHQHQSYELHLHRSVVVMPDGTTVTAVSYAQDDPYERPEPPDYGLYLDRRWQPPWDHDQVDWPDLGVPDDPGELMEALGRARQRARAGERVEIGCLGGHGRTGSALAALAILCGESGDSAVAWVRANYCSQAVESPEQEQFVGGLSRISDSG